MLPATSIVSSVSTVSADALLALQLAGAYSRIIAIDALNVDRTGESFIVFRGRDKCVKGIGRAEKPDGVWNDPQTGEARSVRVPCASLADAQQLADLLIRHYRNEAVEFPADLLERNPLVVPTARALFGEKSIAEQWSPATKRERVGTWDFIHEDRSAARKMAQSAAELEKVLSAQQAQNPDLAAALALIRAAVGAAHAK